MFIRTFNWKKKEKTLQNRKQIDKKYLYSTNCKAFKIKIEGDLLIFDKKIKNKTTINWVQNNSSRIYKRIRYNSGNQWGAEEMKDAKP